MSRYIDSDVLIKAIADIEYETLFEIDDARCNPERYTDNFITGSEYQLQGLAHAAQAILETPTADVRENVRGEWIKRSFIGNWECSLCGSDIVATNQKIANHNFCPNCGAIMRGEKHE